MERGVFRPLLLRCAVLAMACDGELHGDEEKVLRQMVSDMPHFAGTDPDAEIPPILDEVHSSPGVEAALFQTLAAVSMKEHQRYLILEALLNIVSADGLLQSAEVTFMRRTKEALGVSDEDFIVHFPRYVDVAIGKWDEASVKAVAPSPQGFKSGGALPPLS